VIAVTDDIPLACGDHTFPVLPLADAAKLVAMLGFEGFDLSLMGNRSQVRPEVVREDIATWAADLRAVVDENGLRLADVFLIPWTDFSVLAPNSPEPEAREDARALFTDVLELAARMDSPGITLVPGIVWPGRPEAESLARAGEELQWRAERARELGMRCSVEPHVGSVTPTPEAVAELLELAPDLELTLDYTHFVAQGVAEERIEPLINRARHFHARGARLDRPQCSMKENSIDYERIVDQLVGADFDGFIASEYVWIEWERANECDNVSETVMMRDRIRDRLAGREWQYAGAST
jgi:sugar phosphate isomerase/epimerase